MCEFISYIQSSSHYICSAILQTIKKLLKMAKLDGGLRLFVVTAPYSSASYVADMVDMLKLLPKKDIWHYLPQVKELEIKSGKFLRVTKADIVKFAKNNKSKLTTAQFEYITDNWK